MVNRQRTGGGGGGCPLLSLPRPVPRGWGGPAIVALCVCRCERPGQTCGYHVRGQSKYGPGTKLLFCTTGIVLRQLQNNPRSLCGAHVRRPGVRPVRPGAAGPPRSRRISDDKCTGIGGPPALAKHCPRQRKGSPLGGRWVPNGKATRPSTSQRVCRRWDGGACP